ncbi:hypothetical protein [Streptomyces sp. NBC_00887]|uniref:hypothetical protein n=1 Tax=Streptomyces sp. NBC_00887 TaxID=2975859 RepID=UPI00386CE952|nr:hypothetical protein OG844_00595 [Streptomyces sp. NBC_00887]WSY36307.1 hypothetical protein OG844_45000 [Streptomyces sp. NBC_00887]
MTAPHHAPGVQPVIGVDAGTASLRQADHLIHHLMDRLGLPPVTIACTHLIRTDERRCVAITFALPDAEVAEAVWERLADVLGPDAGAVLGGREQGAVLGGREQGPVQATRGATLAAEEHAQQRGGRAVVYPAAERLTGTVTVADLLTLTAIDQVSVVGTPPTGDHELDPAILVLTRDHVRPEWRGGRLTLSLVPAVGGTLAPFEVPNPTPCCADHTSPARPPRAALPALAPPRSLAGESSPTPSPY